MLSTSTYALAGWKGVSGAVNRAALADHLSHRWPDPQETFLVGVQRLPPGHRLDASPTHTSVTRYWDPTPPGKAIDWVRADELDGFDALLETALERCYRQGQSGVFLSGGFPSISIAALATDATRREGAPEPVALSLTFPTEDCNEEEIQREAAQTLGLQHEVLAFENAVAPHGWFGSVLQTASLWPAPILNKWLPAYTRLAERGQQLGVSVFLTGNGGSEWLLASPYLSASRMRNLDVPSWWRLAREWKHANRVSWPRVIRGAVRAYGAWPMASMFLDTAFRHLQMRTRVRRAMRNRPRWLAPDRRLRRELRSRLAAGLEPFRPSVDFYLQGAGSGMDQTRVSLELEETFELGRRLGARILHPYWDADLVDVLYRTPPHMLNRGRGSQGLVRDSVVRRFPTLGFHKHKNAAASSFFRTTVLGEANAMWEQLGGVQALADLQIVDATAAGKIVAAIGSKPKTVPAGQLWDLLTLEAWARTHA